jgi:hypothetical protein
MYTLYTCSEEALGPVITRKKFAPPGGDRERTASIGDVQGEKGNIEQSAVEDSGREKTGPDSGRTGKPVGSCGTEKTGADACGTGKSVADSGGTKKYGLNSGGIKISETAKSSDGAGKSSVGTGSLSDLNFEKSGGQGICAESSGTVETDPNILDQEERLLVLNARPKKEEIEKSDLIKIKKNKDLFFLELNDVSDDSDWSDKSTDTGDSDVVTSDGGDRVTAVISLSPSHGEIKLLCRHFDMFKKDGSKLYQVGGSLLGGWDEIIPKRFECQKCQKSFTYWQQAFAHFWRHFQHKSGESNVDTVVCDICGVISVNMRSHLKHLRYHTLKRNCRHCDFVVDAKVTRVQVAMTQHMKERHQEHLPKFLCEECGRDFLEIHSLKHHHLTAHEPGQGITRPSYFATFAGCKKRIHGERPEPYVVACPYENCDAKVGRRCLTAHINVIHKKERPFVCDYDGCDAKFVDCSHLKRHVVNKHLKVRKFLCQWDGCLAAFRQKYHLQVHVRIHSNDKPLKCPHCNYSARQRNALNWHLKKHGRGHQADESDLESKVAHDEDMESTESRSRTTRLQKMKRNASARCGLERISQKCVSEEEPGTSGRNKPMGDLDSNSSEGGTEEERMTTSIEHSGKKSGKQCNVDEISSERLRRSSRQQKFIRYVEENDTSVDDSGDETEEEAKLPQKKKSAKHQLDKISSKTTKQTIARKKSKPDSDFERTTVANVNKGQTVRSGRKISTKTSFDFQYY